MTKAEYLAAMRKLYRPNIGSDADDMSEADFISDLAEDGWPDHDKWSVVWGRLHSGGEMTPRERECAVAQYMAGEDDAPADMRLP